MNTTTLTSTPRRLILALVAAGAVGATAVSYTHLTLPTNREV